MSTSRPTTHKWLAAGLMAATIAASPAVFAREIGFTIDNLTNGITFRPFLLAAHRGDERMFRAGEPAGDFSGLQEMAECGGLDGLVERMTAAGADVSANPVTDAKPSDPPLGLLFPAGTTEGDTGLFFAGLPGTVSGTLKTTPQNTHLSLVAMLLPTNDAFAGLDSIEIPRKPGTYVYLLPAYDAGTEANDEVPADDNPLDCMVNEPGYPVDPLGNSGVSGSGIVVSSDPDGGDISRAIHVHRGNIGDLDPDGGASDLHASAHRWLNPVVKLTIRVSPDNSE